MERTLSRRRSSCLWFQIVGVETYLLLPAPSPSLRESDRSPESRAAVSTACSSSLPPANPAALPGAGAHQHFRDVGLQQVIQPGRPGLFLECDAQIPAQPVDELQNRARFGLDDAFHHYLANRVSHCNRNAFVCTSIPIYLTLVIQGCSFPEKFEQGTQNLLQRGALL
jgi:hypothetical protein